jgi:uncharacterized membrane-anchored protein YhcB (DUF1043 family)
MDDKKIEETIEGLPETFRPPVDARYDEMWRVIEAAHFDAAETRKSLSRRAFTIAPWLAVAAALLIGVAIGRRSAPALPQTLAATTTAVQAPPASTPGADAYRDQTTRYLEQAASLLISLPNPARPDRLASSSRNSDLADRASDLLVTTRLLLDSPASQDPKLHGLLEDLELVFAQIARLRVDRSKSDLDLIHQAVEQGNVLSRLNSAVSTNPSAE